jgi:hypothetical protein
MRASDPITNLMVAGARLADPSLNTTDKGTLIAAVVTTVTAVRREFPRARPGAPDQGNEVVWSIYCMNPVAVEESYKWEDAMRRINVPTIFGTGVGRAPYACAYCQGRDHPTVGCTLPKRPDWFDTEMLTAEQLPGQNAALTENAASHTANRWGGGRGRGKPQARGGRARGRGRGRGGGDGTFE